MAYAIDAGLTNWINGLSGHERYADALMRWVSSVGVPVMVFAVACQWWSQVNRRHTRHVLLAAGFSFMLGLVLNQLILLFVHRVRPYDAGVTSLLIAPSGDPSFPSDHATAAFAIAVALMAYRFRGAKVYLFAAALISFSRIYVGSHFVSDTIGGALTGMIAVCAVYWTYKENTRADRFLTGIL